MCIFVSSQRERCRLLCDTHNRPRMLVEIPGFFISFSTTSTRGRSCETETCTQHLYVPSLSLCVPLIFHPLGKVCFSYFLAAPTTTENDDDMPRENSTRRYFPINDVSKTLFALSRLCVQRWLKWDSKLYSTYKFVAFSLCELAPPEELSVHVVSNNNKNNPAKHVTVEKYNEKFSTLTMAGCGKSKSTV